MTPARNDYSREILSLIVLVALNALSHFWYVLFAICVGAAFMGMGFLLTRIILRATTVNQAKETR
jgi:hypothetical protein